MTQVSRHCASRRPTPADDQRDVIAFLSDPATYGDAAGKVERIETHGALVFLAGARAYKIKRAVKLAYLDFSTLAKREIACRHEFARNHPAAPEIYLDVRAIRRQQDGRLTLEGDGDGEIVEWVVVMKRFDQDCLFDRLAQAQRLEARHMAELAGRISTYHAKARPVRSADGERSLAGILDQIIRTLAADADQTSICAINRFADRSLKALDTAAPLLRERARDGHVRICHGDLHLRNIVLLDGRPTLFDAIEFDDRIATVDVLYDLAFLLMDLWHRGMRGHANLAFGHYISQAMANETLSGLRALPLFLATRAGVRAMVALDKAAVSRGPGHIEAIRESTDYLDLALKCLRIQEPRLIAVGGFSGTGKSTLAAGLAPTIGNIPGALHLRSDVERKRMAGIDPLDRLPTQAYSETATARVYQRLAERAEQALKAGHSAIVDAVFQKPQQRHAIERAAARAHAKFTGLWLVAPHQEMIERVRRRRGDASDADATVVEQQIAAGSSAMSWDVIDACGSRVEVAERAEAAIACPSNNHIEQWAGLKEPAASILDDISVQNERQKHETDCHLDRHCQRLEGARDAEPRAKQGARGSARHGV